MKSVKSSESQRVGISRSASFSRRSVIAAALLASFVPTVHAQITATGSGATLSEVGTGLSIMDSLSGNTLDLDVQGGLINFQTTGGQVVFDAVGGQSLIDGSLTVGTNLNVTGASTVGNTQVNGTLSSTGATTLNTGGAGKVSAVDDIVKLSSGSQSVVVDSNGVEVSATDKNISLKATNISLKATGASVQASVLVDKNTNTHGLTVMSNSTTLSGGGNALLGTTLTMDDNGFVVTDKTSNDTFRVSNTGAARIGNDALVGSLSIANANGTGGNSVVLDGVSNNITGTTNTTITGGATTLTLDGTGATLNGAVNSITGTTSTAIRGGSTTLTLSNSGASLGGAQLHDVADGTAPTDAVTVRQLNAVVTDNAARFDALSHHVDDVARRSYAGIASVAALAAIPAPSPGKRFSVGLGAGSYAGESATAVGFRAALTDSVSMTAGFSQNAATKTAANVGIGFSW